MPLVEFWGVTEVTPNQSAGGPHLKGHANNLGVFEGEDGMMDDRVATGAQPPGKAPGRGDHTVENLTTEQRHIWARVASSPLGSMWNFEGASPLVVLKRSGKAFVDDDLVSRAAELGYYFLFALFPFLLCASSILGLVAKRTSAFYDTLLNYLAIVIPHSAFQMVIDTFNQTTAAASKGKFIFGLVAALWSASVGFSAIQDTANIVYKVKETRPYWKTKLQAIGVTILLSFVVTLTLGTMLISDYLTKRTGHFVHQHAVIRTEVFLIHLAAWVIVLALLMVLFSLVYYFAPDIKAKSWHWLTPGAAIGIFGWIVASLGLRVYLHYFPSYSATYGSLGAVIILLTWFYVTGLMILAGAEINSEIHAAVVEKQMKERGELPLHATAEKDTPPVQLKAAS